MVYIALIGNWVIKIAVDISRITEGFSFARTVHCFAPPGCLHFRVHHLHNDGSQHGRPWPYAVYGL
jgi:hypothetical protein